MALPGNRFKPEKNTSLKRNKRGFPLIRLLGGCIVLFFIGKQFFRPAATESASESGTIQLATVLPELPLSKVQAPHHLQPHSEKITGTHVVKSGDSFFGILSGFDLKGDESSLIIQAFKRFDATTLFPGDSIVLKRNRDSTFSSIDFYRGSLNKYAVVNRDSVIVARREKLPVTGYTYLLNGSLETSLSEAMYQQGVSDVITAGIADIFAWDINFFIDPRKGDTFQVLFEREVINGKLCGYGAIRAAKYTLSNQKQFYAFGLRDSAGNMHYFDENGKALQKQFLKAPLRFSRISSKFTYRRKHPILGIVRPHLGVDYAAPVGTSVRAVGDGRVTKAGRDGANGKMVQLRHPNGYETLYLHLSTITVKNGASVSQGQVIGKVGSTGLSTGPHLDFRIRRYGKALNPLRMIFPPGDPVPPEKMDQFAPRFYPQDQNGMA